MKNVKKVFPNNSFWFLWFNFSWFCMFIHFTMKYRLCTITDWCPLKISVNVAHFYIETCQMYLLEFTFMSFWSNLIIQWKHFKLSAFLGKLIDLIDWFLVFSAIFSNISAISWRPVLVVEEAGENHRPWESNWLALSLAAASWVYPFCNLQSRAPTHAVLVIGLYELLDNPTT